MTDLFDQPYIPPEPEPPDLSYVPEAIRKKYPGAWLYSPIDTCVPDRDPDDMVITLETWYRLWKFWPFPNKLVIYYKKMQYERI